MELSRPRSLGAAPGPMPAGAVTQMLFRLRQPEARRDIIVIGALLTVAIFIVDLFIPIGIAGGVLYIAPVFLAIWLPDRRLIIGVAGVCSALILAGMSLSPLGSDLTIALPNRVLSLAAVWTVALLSIQRKSFEAALSDSEATNRAVLATTADGILTLDSRGQIVAANPAVEDIFGFGERDLVDHSFSLLLDDEHAETFDRDRRALLDAGASTHPPTLEMVGRHEAGASIPIEIVIVPVEHEDGELYTVTVRDISERRLLEQYLLRKNNDERKAIGVTLHEEVGQALTGLSLISRRLARRLEAMNLAEAREASDLASLLHDLDVQALKLFSAVAPIAANGGLPDALSKLVRATAERKGVPADVSCEDSPTPFDDFTAVQLYDIVRELVDGYLKVAEVESLGLEIGLNGEGHRLAVHFRGVRDLRGIEEGDLLHRLQYRAKLIGARLEAKPSTGGDLVVCCTWPKESAVVNGRSPDA